VLRYEPEEVVELADPDRPGRGSGPDIGGGDTEAVRRGGEETKALADIGGIGI